MKGGVLLAIGCLACAPFPAPGPQRIPVDIRHASTRDASMIADSVARILRRGVAERAFPGAVAIVGRSEGDLAAVAAGRLDWTPGASPPGVETIWDLASLTKVVAMTTAMMQLVDRGDVELDALVRRYVPEWRGPGKLQVTVRHLLTHTSGLPAYRRYDTLTTNTDSIAALLIAEPLDTAAGARMVYSDIGAYLLGVIVARVSGQPLDVYAREQIFAPLGMDDTMFRPPGSLLARIAPTEIDSIRGAIRGSVHDPRAYYLGGVSAHAGLFGSARDLARFARMLLNGGTLDGRRIVRAETIEAFTRRHVADRALGWQKPSGSNSAGHQMSERAFGHTGFTGTSLWIDPAQDVFIVLMSNRVNPTSVNPRISGVRVALANAVMSIITDARPSPTQGRP